MTRCAGNRRVRVEGESVRSLEWGEPEGNQRARVEGRMVRVLAWDDAPVLAPAEVAPRERVVLSEVERARVARCVMVADDLNRFERSGGKPPAPPDGSVRERRPVGWGLLSVAVVLMAVLLGCCAVRG